MKLEILHHPAAKRPATKRPPVLFVHGAYCGAWIWAEHTMPYFAAAGFDCHAMSLRGHGTSEGRCDWASLSDYVDDLVSATATLPEPPILIGHSMGGLIVQHYLSRGMPARAAVLMSTVPPSGLAAAAVHLSMFAPEVMWNLSLLQSLGPEAARLPALHRAFFSPATPLAAISALLPRLQRESQRISMEMMAPTLPRPARGKLPMFVVGGDGDVLIPTISLSETSLYHGAELDVLKGAPHALMLDLAWWQPSADSVLAWLDGKTL